MAMKNLYQVGQSSLGVRTEVGDLRARLFLSSERYRLLDRRQQFYACTQHDYKSHDFDGRMLVPGEGGIAVHQPFLQGGQAGYVPLKLRRPSSPYRLPRVIVNAFTDMVFGEGRFPVLRAEGDANTQDYAQALSRAMRLPIRMIQARNMGGSVGAVGVSWAFQKGKPRARTHNTRDLFVHDWEDREQLIPRWVTEVFQYPQEEWDSRRKAYMRVMYWHRRDWTRNEDILFQPLRVEQGKEPGIDQDWLPDTARSRVHGDGLIHLEWMQNLPSTDPDGEPDYEGLYENFDTIDTMLSVITRGAILNLDPTVKLKMDPDIIGRMGVKKGSDNALIVGIDGDADYMELNGQSIKAGIDLFNAKRRAVLEVAQCVIPDPSEIAASGTSSVAQKMVYASMLGKCDVLREQYATGMERMLSNMIRVAQKATTQVYIRVNEDGSETPVTFEIDLPPIVKTEPVLDAESGLPTAEQSITMEPRQPGTVEEVQSQWGPYFPPTPTDQSAMVTTLSLATGNQPIMSQQSATEIAMGLFNRAPEEEHARIAKEQEQVQARQAEMFAQTNDMGGSVTGEMDIPGGGKVKKSNRPSFGRKPFGGGGGQTKPNPFGKKPFPPKGGDDEDDDA